MVTRTEYLQYAQKQREFQRLRGEMRLFEAYVYLERAAKQLHRENVELRRRLGEEDDGDEW